MFNTDKFTKNNKEAEKVLGELKLNNTITDEQYYAIKKALEDAKYSICEGTYSNQDNAGEVLAHIIDDYVNGSNGSEEDKGLVTYLSVTMHRYLQGEWFKIMMRYIKTISMLPDYCFDGRNEFTQIIAKEIVENNPKYFEYEKDYVPEWTKR